MAPPVKTKTKDSQYHEWYTEKPDAEKRYAALESSGRKPILATFYDNPPAGDEAPVTVLYEVAWYEPRRGNPDFYTVKPLPPLEGE